MINRLLLVLLSVSLLIIPALGCITDDSKTTVSPITNDIATMKVQIATHGTDISKLRDDLSKKADSTRVDALAGGAGAATAGYAKAETYTKAEVDTKMASMQAIIDGLSAKITNLMPGVGGNNPTSVTGNVQFTNNPVAIPQIFSSSSGGNSNPWIMTINNSSTTWQYVKPMVSLNVASGQPSSIVSDVSLMTSGGSCSLTGTLLAPGNFTFSPSNMATVATPSVIIFPISGCNGSGEWYIGPGQSQSYNIQIQGLKTPNPILWNVSASISSRSM
jgi:hypothetical protein